jgi:hypothetical protein
MNPPTDRRGTLNPKALMPITGPGGQPVTTTCEACHAMAQVCEAVNAGQALAAGRAPPPGAPIAPGGTWNYLGGIHAWYMCVCLNPNCGHRWTVNEIRYAEISGQQPPPPPLPPPDPWRMP